MTAYEEIEIYFHSIEEPHSFMRRAYAANLLRADISHLWDKNKCIKDLYDSLVSVADKKSKEDARGIINVMKKAAFADFILGWIYNKEGISDMIDADIAQADDFIDWQIITHQVFDDDFFQFEYESTVIKD